jgi:hypothetical protein
MYTPEALKGKKYKALERNVKWAGCLMATRLIGGEYYTLRAAFATGWKAGNTN